MLINHSPGLPLVCLVVLVYNQGHMYPVKVDLSRISHELHGAPITPTPSPVSSPRPRRPKLFVMIGLFLVILVVGWRAITAPPADPTAPQTFWTQVKRLVLSNDRTLTGEADDRINLLLLGMGGVGHDGPYLTDTIILASFQPSTNQVSLLSIPRDLVMPIAGYGWRKINNANAYGEAAKPGAGGELAGRTISTVFQIPINYYVRIDFSGFTEFIDELGGINVCVDTAFTDQQYPTDDYGIQTVEFAAGCQDMDGARALEFVRSRHGSNGEGSDFARSRRQQKVILAAKEKFLSFSTLGNPLTIRRLYRQFVDHLATNLELGAMIRLADLARGVSKDKIVTLGLTEGPGGHLETIIGEDGAFLLQPPGGNYDEIRQLVANMLTTAATVVEVMPPPAPEPTPTAETKQATKEKARVEIRNGTFISGLAGEVQVHLQTLGFTVPTVGNAPFRDFERTVLYDLSGGKYPQTVTALTTELNANQASVIPGWVKNIADSDLVIVLGKTAGEKEW